MTLSVERSSERIIQPTSRLRDELVLISLLRHAASVFHLARNGGEVRGWENGGGWPGTAGDDPSTIYSAIVDATNSIMIHILYLVQRGM